MDAVKDKEEVIDMKVNEDGKWESHALVKVRKDEDQVSTQRMDERVRRDLPRGVLIANEILGGFVVGMNALENFVEAMNRSERRGRRRK